MSIKLVICDMAGTTVHDNDDVNICFQAALESTGLEITRDDINEVMGLRKPDAIRMILEKKLEDHSDITDEYIHELHDVFLKKMIDFYTNDPRVKEVEGASDFFRTLKKNGIIVGLDTGFSKDIMDTIIERLGWKRDGLIDVAVASDEVENGRPHADMIKKAMGIVGVESMSEVAKVGDTPADLNEGKNAGCTYNIGVLSGAYTKEELESYTYTHLVDSVKDIPPILLKQTVEQ